MRVEFAGNVDSSQMPREPLGHRGIREPAVITGTEFRQLAPRFLRVTDAVDVERQAGIACRLQQIVDDFIAALAIAPVADPDYAVPSSFSGRRAKPTGVGSFVPDKRPFAPSQALIDTRESRAECKDAVVSAEIEGAQVVGRRNCAVVRIVEQKGETPAAGTKP